MICLGAGERAPKTKIVLRTVKGAQAQGARERLGLIKVTKPSAKQLWDFDIPIVLIGNNVNAHHFFDGWSLAYRVEPSKLKGEDWTFDRLVGDFNFYMDRELGRAVAFFVFADELAKSLRDDKSSMEKAGIEV